MCGRQVTDGKKTAVLIDGTIFNVCMQCSRRGKPYLPAESPSKKKSVAMHTPRKSSPKIPMIDETILDPNFARIIREARVKKGLTHEQLGARMNEKATLLKKIETGTLKPDEILARKLEIFLGIKLYIKSQEEGENDK